MNLARKPAMLWALNNASLLLFSLVFLTFALLTPKFVDPQNLVNIVVQASSTAIVAVGMTFVLLTAGVDLSVGAIMFVAAAIAGKLTVGGWPLSAALAVILVVGLLFGAVNALCVTRLRIVPFIVTLATLYMGRGLGLLITETRALNLPDNFLALGTARLLGVPMPVLILLLVVVVAHGVLTRTPFGRHIYAVGENADNAAKAGIGTGAVLASVYVISGFCAALGGIVSLSQLGAVSPTFGSQKEFAAIAAAVLGGTSLFGGRGRVFPGTVFGAILIQTVENGLVILNADPYLYPLVTSAIIFVAVLVDSWRASFQSELTRRRIRLEVGES